MGDGVLAGSGWSEDFGEEVVGEWQLGSGGSHPPYAVLDRLRGDEVAAGHCFDRGGWFTSQAGPVQHRFGAALQRTEDPPGQLGHHLWTVNPGSGVPLRPRVRCPMKAWQACTSSIVSCG